MNDIVCNFEELNDYLQPGNKNILNSIVNDDFSVRLRDNIFFSASIFSEPPEEDDDTAFYINIKTMVFIGDLYSYYNTSDRNKRNEKSCLVSMKNSGRFLIDISRQIWPDVIDDIIQIVRRDANKLIEESANKLNLFFNGPILDFLDNDEEDRNYEALTAEDFDDEWSQDEAPEDDEEINGFGDVEKKTELEKLTEKYQKEIVKKRLFSVRRINSMLKINKNQPDSRDTTDYDHDCDSIEESSPDDNYLENLFKRHKDKKKGNRNPK